MRDYEYQTDVPASYGVPSGEPAITVYISAAGGGDLGVAYRWQRWLWAVEIDNEIIAEGSDLGSNDTAATHADMARILANFLAVAGESLYWSGDRSEYAREYAGPVRAFLENECERLALFADEPALLGAE